jgi:transcription initiation factor TFIIIB Brf1 subunit/transcription initiation factor TFIIB
MTPKSPPSPQSVDMKPPCKHPRVQIVSRDQESEFVECKECGEIFESSEFKDMGIEENTQEREM